MLSDYFTNIRQAEIYAIIAFIIFFLFFILITIHTLSLRNRDVEKLKNLPFEEEPGNNQLLKE